MADVVSREKSLDKEIIFQAIEAALATATRKKHSIDIEARVFIHRETGDYDTFRQWEVVDDEVEIEFPERQIKISEALVDYPDIDAGDIIEVRQHPRSLCWRCRLHR